MPTQPLELPAITKLVGKLQTELDARQGPMKRWDDYYEGEHDLAFASEKFQEAFGGLFAGFADNWCGVVCDSPAERLAPIGFRFGDGHTPQRPATDASEPVEPVDPGIGDRDAMEIWQRNNMDAEAQLLILESLVKSRSFVLVWGDEDDDDKAVLTSEDATQVVVAYAAGSRRRRLAALKRWTEDDGQEYCTVYTPDWIYKLKRRKGAGIQVTSSTSGPSDVLWVPPSSRGTVGAGMATPWEARSGNDADDIVENPLGAVPIVELRNKPRLMKPPTAEHQQVIPLQGAVNKLFADLMVGAEAGAFPARWATGLEAPRDPRTGQELEDPELWRAAVSKLVRSRNKDAKFGNFDATDLSNLVGAIEMVLAHIGAKSRTPSHYLLPKLVNVSGDALVAAEAGLVAKCRDKTDLLGDAFEEVMRLAFAVSDDPRSEVYTAETIWRDVQHRSDASRSDALIKKKEGGVPWRQRMEDYGYTPAQIDRMVVMRREDAELDALGLGLDDKARTDELDRADLDVDELDLDAIPT